MHCWAFVRRTKQTKKFDEFAVFYFKNFKNVAIEIALLTPQAFELWIFEFVFSNFTLSLFFGWVRTFAGDDFEPLLIGDRQAWLGPVYGYALKAMHWLDDHADTPGRLHTKLSSYMLLGLPTWEARTCRALREKVALNFVHSEMKQIEQTWKSECGTMRSCTLWCAFSPPH